MAPSERQPEAAAWTPVALLRSAGCAEAWRVSRGGTWGVRKAVRTADSVLRARAAREAAWLRRLAGPGLPELLDAGEGPDHAWMVTRWVDGVGGDALVAPPGLPPDVALGLIRQLAEVVARLHAAGVAHRDLTPANLRARPTGELVVLDLGAAWSADDAALTVADAGPPGSPRWAPPEWFDGRGLDPFAADVYAVGVVAWELLAGAPAFPPLPREALAAAKRTRGVWDPPDVAWSLLADAVAVDASARPSAATLAARLAGWPAVALPAQTTAVSSLASGSSPLEAKGTLGRYLLREELGRGGAGVVHRAHDPALGRDIAIKRLFRADDPRAVARFLREGRALAALDHRGIVAVLDVGADGGEPYLAMELVDGVDLRTLLAARRPSLDEALAWAAQLADALAAAHAAGVVHRDLKPGNVLIDRAGRARLVDFGLAAAAASVDLTRTGQLIGTPAYLAPEAAAGGEVDARADVYGLGVLLYELVAGRPPFSGAHPAAVVHAVLHALPEPLDRAAPGAPAPLCRVVHRAMARAPADRYPDVVAFADDLRRAAAGDRVLAPSPTWSRLVHRWRAGRLVVGVVGVIVAVGLGARALAWREASAREAWAASRLEVVDAEVGALMAQGRADEAERALVEFTGLSAVRGTSAASAAWARHAARLGPSDAPGAAARAYALAAQPDDELAALLVMGRAHAAAGDLDALRGVDALITRRGHGHPDPDLADRARGARRALAAVTGAGLRPVAQALSRGVPVGWVDRFPDARGAFDLDGDGRQELVSYLSDGRVVVAAAGAWDQPPREVGHFGAPLGGLRVVDGGRFGPLLVLHTDTRDRPRELLLVRLTPTPEVVLRWPSDPFCEARALDLDGDGQPTVYVTPCTYQRDLVALVPDADGARWTVTHPHPPTSEANSDAVGFVALGEGELAVATTGWGAFDLRVLGVAPDDAHLTLLRRRKLGPLHGIVGLPERGQVAVLRAGEVVLPEVFGADRPSGAPQGVYVFDRSLADPVWHLPRAGLTRAGGGDLDGDGLTDLWALAEAGLVVARQLPGDRFAAFDLAGVAVLDAGDADGDGDVELLVRVDGEAWLLGTGDQPLPERPPAIDPAPVPSVGHASLRRAWERAEDLVTLGQAAVAVDLLGDLAALDDGALGGLALLRAAALADELGDTDRALAVLDRAAQRPDLTGRACAAAAALAARVHRYGEAVGWWDRAAAVGEVAADDPRRAAWSARAAAPVTALFTPGGALAPGLDILRPLAWSPSPDGVVVSVAQRGEIARARLRRVGDVVGLSVALEVLRGEYDADFEIALGPVGAAAPVWQFDLHGHGGARNVDAHVGAYGSHAPGWLWYGPMPTTAWALPLRFDARAADGAMSLHQVTPAGVRRAGPSPFDAPGGLWELVVRGGPGDGPAPVMTVRLTSLELRGFELVPPPPDALADARRELAMGRPAALAAWPAGQSPETDGLAAVALDDLGRADEAAARLRRALAGGDAPWLASVLRGRAPGLVPVARDALGPRWPSAFHRAWASTLHAHPDDPAARDALLVQLGAIDPAAVPPDAPCAWLLRQRATAQLELGRPDAARLSAEAAGRCANSDAPDRGARLTAALLAEADPPAAMAVLRAALAAVPAPELLADRLVVDPRLAPLHTQPGWAEIEAARREVGE